MSASNSTIRADRSQLARRLKESLLDQPPKSSQIAHRSEPAITRPRRVIIAINGHHSSPLSIHKVAIVDM